MQVLRVCRFSTFALPPAFPPCSCPLAFQRQVRRLTSRMSSESYPGYPECVVSCHGAGRFANSIRALSVCLSGRIASIMRGTSGRSSRQPPLGCDARSWYLVCSYKSLFSSNVEGEHRLSNSSCAGAGTGVDARGFCQ